MSRLSISSSFLVYCHLRYSLDGNLVKSKKKRLHIYPLCGIFYFPWHRHQIEGTNGFYCLIRKTERFTISNVESQVFTPNNSRLDPGSNPGCPRDKRMSYHWTNCASLTVKGGLYRIQILCRRYQFWSYPAV